MSSYLKYITEQLNIIEIKCEKFENELKKIKEQGKYGCKLKCEEFTNTFAHKTEPRRKISGVGE